MPEAAAHPPDFQALFKGEAEEYLVILSKGLLSLEKNPALPAVIDDLFRAAHTLKGALRMMGHMAIQDNAHLLEDIFGKMKSGDAAPTHEVIEKALKTLGRHHRSAQYLMARSKPSAGPDATGTRDIRRIHPHSGQPD